MRLGDPPSPNFTLFPLEFGLLAADWLACVFSLALELQASLWTRNTSETDSSRLKAMVDAVGDCSISSLQEHGFFVAPDLPPQVDRNKTSPATTIRTTLRTVVQKRATACDRCLKAAVTAGWTNMKHLREDRDLRLYLASADTSWLPAAVP